MMTTGVRAKRAQLEQSAMSTAISRGHRMTPFASLYEQAHIAESVCEKCEAYVQVNAKPKGREVQSGGTALILDCKGDNDND